MGCVCYDPSVSDIWSGIQNYLVHECGVPFDYVLFTNYERQVQALVDGHLDVAWNGPLAHVLLEEQVMRRNTANQTTNAVEKPEQVEVVSLGMRDVDRNVPWALVVRRQDGITSLDDLKEQSAQVHLVTGTRDSPQAHLIPMYYLTQEQHMTFASVTSLDYDLGRHGDTAIGEIKALEQLVVSATATATATSTATAATTSQPSVAIVSQMMWDRAIQGVLPTVNATALQETCMILNNANFPVLDHCQFDAIIPMTTTSTTTTKEDVDTKMAKLNNFGQALLAMDWTIPEQQRLMKLEGIQNQWMPPRQTGYDIVRQSRRLDLTQHVVARNFQYSGN
jgi:phosphonate transport system substrate-binding protein